MNVKPDVVLDAKGLLCPMPTIKTVQRVKEMKSGEIIEIQATDIGIKPDMENWCKMTGNELLGIEEDGTTYRVYIRKTAG